MSENKWGLYSLIIGIIELNLNLFLYIYFESEEIVLWVILVSLAVIVLIILMDKLGRIEENSNKISSLIEKLKRKEELDDIRLDVRELKRKVLR